MSVSTGESQQLSVETGTKTPIVGFVIAFRRSYFEVAGE